MIHGTWKSIMAMSIMVILMTSMVPSATAEDTTAPVVKIKSPKDGDTVKGNVIKVKGTAKDEGGSGIKRIEYKTDEDDNWIHIADTPTNPNWEIGVGFEKAGEHNIKVRAKDGDGNAGETNITITVEFEKEDAPQEIALTITGLIIVIIVLVVFVIGLTRPGKSEDDDGQRLRSKKKDPKEGK